MSGVDEPEFQPVINTGPFFPDLLKSKTALVTGGSRGIGRATALALAEAGADVAINYQRSAQAAEEVRNLAAGMGVRATTYQADVARDDEANPMVQAVLPGMVESGWGRVINITSVVGQTGSFGQADYAVTKGGLISFTMTLAREVARKGITVNAGMYM